MGEDWMEEVAKAGGWKKHKILALRQELELKKEEVKLMKELAKIQPDTWKDIRESTQNLKDFVVGGGTTEIMEFLTSNIKETISTAIEGKLSSLLNEIDTIIGENPVIQQILGYVEIVSNALSDFVGGNITGTFWGALSGWVISLIAPGGAVWTLIGALLGALIEDAIKNAFLVEGDPRDPLKGMGGLQGSLNDWLRDLFGISDPTDKEPEGGGGGEHSYRGR